MEIKKRWAILNCPTCKKKTYWYLADDYKNLSIEEQIDAMKSNNGVYCRDCGTTRDIILYKDWTVKEIANIFGKELDFKDYCYFAYMPHHLIEAMNKANVSTEEQACIMRLFMEEMSKNW